MDKGKVQVKKNAEAEKTRLGALTSWQSVVFIILTILGIAIGCYYIFGFSFRGRVMFDAEYYWLFIGIFTAAAFISLPGSRKATRLPWYDILFAAVALVISVYCFMHAQDIIMIGWSNVPLGIVIWFLMMEAARRGGGVSFLIVVLLLGLYPLVAHLAPGVLKGINYGFPQTIQAHIFRNEGMMGIGTKIAAEVILGFLVFAGVLLASGGGQFFIDFANAIFGRFRGGPAKVAVVASAFFGSLSGSVFSNIAGTGSFTIPTMKKAGFPPHYAGAIEATASTGGVLMPPVMGAIAFVMAVTIGVEYRVIMVAAIVPSFLFYLGLLLQVDAHAAKHHLSGMPREQIPSMKKVLARGWHFLSVLVFLVWGLLYMRWEYFAPWYATILMVGLSFMHRDTWMTPKKLFATIRQIGMLIAQTSAIILPIAFVISGLTITGVTGSVTSGLVHMGGGNLYLVLLFGVAACFIMGMAGLAIVAYIFLAVTLAPAIVNLGGLNVIAVHLFIVYYSMLSTITPPVGAAAFLAGTIANAPPMQTCMTAMRLGVVIYFIPLFFIFQPALVLQGDLMALIYLLPSCIIGIVFIAAGFEGYLFIIGRLRNWARAPFVIIGLALSFPTLVVTVAGFLAATVLLVLLWMQNRNAPAVSSI